MAIPEFKLLNSDADRETNGHANGTEPFLHSFERREIKYSIPGEWKTDKFIELVHKFYPIAPFRPDIFPTIIRTTWCEPPDWSSLKAYLERKEFRFKLRVRRYGSTRGFSDCSFIELKTKTEYDKISRKYRFKCPYSLIPEFFNGKDIRPEIERLNTSVGKFDEIYTYARNLVVDRGFKPLLRAQYSRAYFQKSKLDPIRLTLDGRVRFTYLPDSRAYTEKFRILESKVRAGADMDKLDELLNAVCAQRVYRFSKYHRALKVFEPGIIDRINSLI